mmetsp:Transcript_18086/g.39557  ORF Transcript_18086/g.39557 Transcript_18086/m.39557 type:complete len:113 (-) Transcript_18086:1000-1338(-)
MSEGQAKVEGPRENCTPYFDTIWFCYSPAHQWTTYYQQGTVDDCTQHWNDLYDCLKQRTKFKDIVPVKEPPKPMWTIRTPEEAAEFWKHMSGGASAQQAEAPKTSINEWHQR